jgi:ribosomal subunit interface protein
LTSRPGDATSRARNLESFMDVRVSGHQLETGEALRESVAARLGAIADKYSSRIVSAQVTFGKGPHDHGFTCEVVAYAPQGLVLKAADRAADARAAFDATADKVEKQLRRHNRKMKDHHALPPGEALEVAQALAYRRGQG